jgi:hypothetical protein
LNTKIVVSVFSAFVIAFILLSVFMYNSKIGNIDSLENEINFYDNLDQSTNKIFLLGNSHIMPLNNTFIQDHISNSHENYTVYNLAIGSSEPKDRLQTIDYIISTKPSMIVYGIAERDFRSTIPLTDNKNSKPQLLPDLQQFFDEQVWKLGLKNLNFMENPKFTTLTTLYDFTLKIWKKDTNQVSNKIERFHPYPNMPFYKITTNDIPILTNDELYDYVKETRVGNFREINLPYSNVDVIALKEIINRIKSHDIKFILFTTPHHQSYLDVTPDSINDRFELIIENIELEFNIEIHELTNKYVDLEIWNDPTHIAVSQKSLIYSEDISNIILGEMD